MLLLEQIEIWFFIGATVILGHMVPVRNSLGAFASVLFVIVIVWAGIYGYLISGITGLLWYLGAVLVNGFWAIGNGKRIVHRNS